jgi:sugar lactone lactonase YvrE
VLGIAFDNRDRMYVLENTDGQPFPTPGYGDVVRIDPSGKKTVVVENLALPTGITFGPDGAMYISNLGFGPPPSLPEGPGMVLRVTGF